MSKPRPFRIDVPPSEVEDLKSRIRATRWPSPATMPGWSQGVPLDYLRELAEHWASRWDWRVTQERLNRVPQVLHDVGGVTIHAFHARSPHPEASPDAWMARVLLRVRRHRRATHSPGASWRHDSRSLPCRAAEPAGLRIQQQAFRGRVGCGPHRRRLDRPDGGARLHTLRGRWERLGHQRLDLAWAAAP